MRNLNLETFPLDGTRLIEASAGTGKTFTIAGLYLRLLLDAQDNLGRNLEPEDILVVTFTEAATEELRDRIRSRLRDAAETFGRGEAPDGDPLLAHLLARTEDMAAAAERLNDMLTRMDTAAIHTIHGFCNRCLQDNAFESGTLFDNRFITDEQPLREAVIEDFWRSRFYDVDVEYAAWVRREWREPADLLKEIKNYLNKTELDVIPEPAPGTELAARREELRRHFSRLADLWRDTAEEALALLLDGVAAKHISGAKEAYKPEHLEGLWPVWDAWFRAPRLPLPEKFDLLTAGGLEQRMMKPARKAGIAPPAHALFDTCQAAADAAAVLTDQQRIGILHDALEYLRRELAQRKDQQHVLSFDDLLERLATALAGSRGDALAEAVARRHPVALIDEFQDTDPQQYAIFSRIYDGRSGCGLFMIGDPKQAIYSFRGADIFTYMQARRATAPDDGRYTLGTNWRSTDSLVRGVDSLFRRNPRRFIFDEDIGLPAVAAAGRSDRNPLRIEGETSTGLHVWCLPTAEDRNGKPKPISKNAAAPRLAAATAGEIARLLEASTRGAATLGEDALQPRDIAVLVRDQYQAAAMKSALQARGIASVHHSRESVFATDEAEELFRLLRAVAEPEDEALLRNAACTRLLGVTGDQLESELRAGLPWERRVESFTGYRQRWEEHGLLPMLHTLLHEQGVTSRLLAVAEGERRLTNLLHLGELLQTAAAEQYGLAGLMTWFREQLDDPSNLGERAELRLESDAELVHIVTIHKSKGLQYPVVFLPFLASGRGPSDKGPVLFHRDEGEGRLTLDLGTEAQSRHRVLARRETMAEDLRLLYVALTRAVHCCYLAWGLIKDGEHSGLAYLLHPPEDPDAAEPVAQLDGLNAESLHKPWHELHAAAPGCFTISAIETVEAGAVAAPSAHDRRLRGRALPLTTTVPQNWRVTSYSGLLGGHGGTALERPDYDAVDTESEDATEAVEPDIFAFPRGARAGSCLHRILELADFTDDAGLEALVQRQLVAFGFGLEWTQVLSDHLRNVLACPLPDGMSLKQLPRAQRLDELAFYFPVHRLRARTLEALLPPLPVDVPRPPLTFGRVSGMLKGFIDLVFEHEGRFYIVDYKSNYLGDRPQHYDLVRMSRAVADHRYDLQYMLYSLALHRYLGSRLPDYDYERHFGGVYYLFLRGMTPSGDDHPGVFRFRPKRDALAELDALMADAGGSA